MNDKESNSFFFLLMFYRNCDNSNVTNDAVLTNAVKIVFFMQ